MRGVKVLFLRRKEDEEIIINPGKTDEMLLRICQTHPELGVTLGFLAPRHIEIWRKEIWLPKQLKQQWAREY